MKIFFSVQQKQYFSFKLGRRTCWECPLNIGKCFQGGKNVSFVKQPVSFIQLLAKYPSFEKHSDLEVMLIISATVFIVKTIEVLLNKQGL